MKDHTISELKDKCVNNDNELTPLERCWAIRNYIGTTTQRFDIADSIGATICDMMIPFMLIAKMRHGTDYVSVEYWSKTKEYLLGAR
jgi:hypothetical protein